MTMLRGVPTVALAVLIVACGSESTEDPPTQVPTSPQGTSQIPGFPSGWLGGTTAPSSYELGRDVAIKHGGSASGYLKSLGTQTPFNSFIAYTQLVRADLYRGKRVRLSGYVRTGDIPAATVGGGAALWLRADAPWRQAAFDNMERRRLTGTRDWEFAEVVLDIDNDVVGLAFGALLAGPGIAWIDDLKLEIVGTDVDVTEPSESGQPALPDSAAIVAHYEGRNLEPLNLDFEGVTLPESDAATVDWVKSHSFPFLTDDPAVADADLAPLRQTIGSATLVAVGEGTHGTREFFRMKHRVFSFLVRNLGFTHFGIEASLPEALAVDHYVQTGIGDPATVVRGMLFWTWSTEEVMDLVRWMRQWNANGGQPRVHFTGFDMQFPGVAMDSVQAFATQMEAAAGDSVNAAYACLVPFRNVGTRSPDYDGYSALTVAEQDACRTTLASVDSMFARNLGQWSATSSAARAKLMQRLARLVSQWEDYARSIQTAARDKYMAENIVWWREYTNQAPTMLWAHNAHIGRRNPWMGTHLATRFGADYLNIAQTFGAGSFNVIPRLPSGVFGSLAIHGFSGPVPGSLEAVLNATNLTHAVFDARAIPGGGPAASSLRTRLTMRAIGSVYPALSPPEVNQVPILLPAEFDVIIWFRETVASRLSLGSVASDRLRLPFP